jgi:glycosyltransferase involved in cell wall biosynthesis
MSTHNGAKYLREAVDSILGQSCADLEFIIIDDGSTDGTADVLGAYSDPRIRVLRQENRGLTRSLNRGIREARGVFIARQDSDDFSLPGRLAKQAEFLSAHPEVALVGTAMNVVAEQGELLATFRQPCDAETIMSSLRKHNCICHGSVMFRRACFEQAGGYREEFSATQDYDLWLRFSELFHLANLDEPLYAYRFTTGSITVKKMVTQHRLAVLARQLAETRANGGNETERLEGVASYLASPLTLAERLDIISNYKPWCRLLLKNDLPHEAASLMTALFRYHPRLWFRAAFTLGKALKSPSILARLLENA